MLDLLKLLIKYMMRLCLKALWVFPIKKKTVLFMANMGKGFLCNPKYLYNSMADDSRFADYTFIWCFTDPNKYNKTQFSRKTKIVNKNNLIKYLYSLLTSEIIVYNCGGFSYAPIRKSQFLIETGHGGGLQKKNGFLVESKSHYSNKGIELASKDIKLWLASDEMHEKIYIRQAMNYYGEVLKSGYPRSDIFFRENVFLKRKIKADLGVIDDLRIVLYAPTFKGSERHASSFSDGAELIDVQLVKKALSNRFGGDWIFASRGHMYSQSVPLSHVDCDWTTYSDMQELLLISDVLITDYSSCVWDFFLQGKPTFLYVPDRAYYEMKDRGFYIPLERWPGIIVNNNDEWCTVVSNFDEKSYKQRLESYSKMMTPYDNGSACEMVKDRIVRQFKR